VARKKKKEENFFRVIYRDPVEDKIVTLRASSIQDSNLGPTFIRISEFIFDQNNIVVDPSQENLKKHFQGVESIHLSIYTVVCIEEMGAENSGLQFQQDRSNLIVLPGKDSTTK